MIYKYKIYCDKMWKKGKIEASSLEEAARFIRNIHQIKEKENTIVLNEELDKTY